MSIRPGGPSKADLSGTFSRVVEGPLSGLDARVGLVGDDATDNAAAFGRANALLQTAPGGEMFLPPGSYRTSAKVTIPGGATYRGAGINYPGIANPAARSSIIRPMAAMATLMQLGLVASNPSDPSNYSTTNTGATLRGVIVDGMNLADTVVDSISPRWFVDAAEITRGLVTGLLVSTGQNGLCADSVISMDDRGTCVDNAFEADNKFHRSQVRGGTTARFRLAGYNSEVQGCHIFPNQTSEVGPDIICDGRSNPLWGFFINNNTFGANNQADPHILIKNAARGVQINDNRFYMALYGRSNVPIVRIDANTFVQAVEINGNMAFIISTTVGGSQYSALLDVTGPNPVDGLILANNLGRGITTLVTGITPDSRVGNVIRDNAAGKSRYDSRAGKTNVVGTGSAAQFNITHNLGATPVAVHVTNGSTLPAGTSYKVTADDTLLYVTFSTALPNAWSMDLNWQVRAG